VEHQHLFILAVLAFAAFAYLTWRADRKRREELRSWARTRGFTFRAAKDGGLGRRYPDLAPLQRGRRRHARNVMTGERQGRPVTAFDYRYVTGHGKNRRTHNLSAVVVRSPHPLIPLQIRGENVFDRVGEFLGVNDIDFESAEFSRRFHVSSPDRKWAYDVLHARTIAYLLREGFCNLVFDGWHVMAYRSRRFSPREFTRAIELAAGILERIPDYVVREMTGRDSQPASPPRERD
jgi:hypothetical protein